MTDIRDKTHRALKRMLANGPLTAVPRRPADQELLLALAASRFEAHRSYRENEVNELLTGWLESFCAPFGIDHVTLRRLLVDSRRLTRTRSGSTYRIDPKKIGEVEADETIEPARVLAEIQDQRERRKRQHAS